MSKITVSAEVAALLKTLTAESELCDPDGRHLGFFVPLEEDNVTLEELKAADAAGGEYTMEDVLKLLEKHK